MQHFSKYFFKVRSLSKNKSGRDCKNSPAHKFFKIYIWTCNFENVVNCRTVKFSLCINREFDKIIKNYFVNYNC